MNILADAIEDWASPDKLIKAGKKVGISSKGLSIEWMDLDMFARAEAILHPGTPTKSCSVEVDSPKGVRKYGTQYLKIKCLNACELLAERQNQEFPLDEVEGLLPYKTVKPTATQRKKITDVHGSLRATDIRKLVEEREIEERKKEEKKKRKSEFERSFKSAVSNLQGKMSV